MVPLPPFVAVRVTLLQKTPLVGVTVTVAAGAFTVIVRIFEFTVVGFTQPVATICTRTVLPFASVLDIKVLLVAPDTALPFTAHW
jgi:hypothetical protein